MGIKKTMLAMIGIVEDGEEISEPDRQVHGTELENTSSFDTERSLPLPIKYINREMLLKIVITSPIGREDCTSIVNSLRDNNLVIVDFSKAEHNEAHRCFNYLLGATYALNGSAQRISSDIYVFASEKMKISVI